MSLTWHHYRRGDTCEALTAEDIAVVVPHVAQAGAVRAMLADLPEILVGTVNGLQGLVRNPVPSPGAPDAPHRSGHRSAAGRRHRRPASRAGAGGAGRAVDRRRHGPPTPPLPARGGVGVGVIAFAAGNGPCRWVAVVSSVLGKPVGQALGFGRGSSWRFTATGIAWTDRKAARARRYQRRTLSGSGDAYYRCDHHDAAYTDRLRPVMDGISRRARITSMDSPTACTLCRGVNLRPPIASMESQ